MNQPVCAIVGFGSGVSLGVAKAFGNEGYALALIARTPTKLAAAATALQQQGMTVQTFAADAGQPDALVQAMTQVQAAMGDPEVLVYNAATFTVGQPTTLTVAQLTADWRVNVVGALVAVQQVVPAMRSRGQGTILLTGGGLALNPMADVASLAIGKAGLRNLTFSLAQELASSGIHVATVTICGMVAPGTLFDPDAIAQAYLALHHQPKADWQTEWVYQ